MQIKDASNWRQELGYSKPHPPVSSEPQTSIQIAPDLCHIWNALQQGSSGCAGPLSASVPSVFWPGQTLMAPPSWWGVGSPIHVLLLLTSLLSLCCRHVGVPWFWSPGCRPYHSWRGSSTQHWIASLVVVHPSPWSTSSRSKQIISVASMAKFSGATYTPLLQRFRLSGIL